MGCYNSTVINATAEEVWEKLNDFHDLLWSENVVDSVKKAGNKPGNKPGAQRILNDAFHETLLSIDDEAYVFTYSIDDGPGAVSKGNVQGYVGTVSVHPVTDTNSAFVEWKSEWENKNEESVADFGNPIYHSLLHYLKSHLS